MLFMKKKEDRKKEKKKKKKKEKQKATPTQFMVLHRLHTCSKISSEIMLLQKPCIMTSKSIKKSFGPVSSRCG